MIISIALTQFVFISLGILAVNVLLKAGGFAQNVESSFPDFTVWMASQSLWFFIIPLAWIAFAALCDRVKRGLLSESGARFTGVAIVIGIFVAYFRACLLLL